MRSTLRLAVVLSVILLIGLAGDAWAQDVLILDVGDQMTGRLKRLERGELVFDTPYTDGDIYVEWRRVQRIQSNRVFQFKTVDGERFLGRIRPEAVAEVETLIVESEGVTRTLRRSDIVRVVETLGELRGFLESRLAVGVTVSASNDQAQFNAGGAIGYETVAWNLSFVGDSIFSTQRQGANTNRHHASLRFTKNLGRWWGLTVLNDYLHSEEQSLDLRTVIGGGPSRVFVRDGRIELEGVGGVVWNNERYDATQGNDVNDELEGLLGVAFSFFQFRQWELDSSFLVFPSITTAGRVRSSLTADLRLRLIRGRSLWWNLSQTVDLDNNPPSDSRGVDYVTVTSLSWGFP